MKTFHHSTLESPRIAKLLAHLEAKGEQGATTLELCEQCISTRASSDVSELRACLVDSPRWIETVFEGTNENGRRVHRYILRQRQSVEREEYKAAQDIAYESPSSITEQMELV